LGKRRTGQSWAKGLIVELWTINWNIWEHRNTRKHTEDTPEAQATLEDLKEQVRQEFRIGPAGMLQQDQHLLSSPTTVFRHYRTIPQLQSWILKIQLAREYASRTLAEQALQQQQTNQQNSAASRKFLFDFLRHGHATVSPTFGRPLNPDGTLLTYDDDDVDSVFSTRHTPTELSIADSADENSTPQPEL